MQVLLTAATPFEIAPVIGWLERNFEQKSQGNFQQGTLEIRVRITGVGMVATAWRLAGLVAPEKPDFVLNAGIAGALDTRLQLGDVVYIASEQLADLGVENADGHFTDLFELGLQAPGDFPFTAGKLLNPGADYSHYLPKVAGITVNKAHGSVNSIARLRQKYPDAQVESMEGAAFFYGCLLSSVPFAEIRSISNYVEPRNREAWDLPGAIIALNTVLEEMLKGFPVV